MNGTEVEELRGGEVGSLRGNRRNKSRRNKGIQVDGEKRRKGKMKG